MPALLLFCLAVSLAASPLLLASFTRLHFQPWALVPRMTLWAAAIVVVVIAAEGVGAWRLHFGIVWPTWGGVGWSVVAAAVMFGVMGASLYIQQSLGSHSQKQQALHKLLVNLPFGYRCLIVVTAAVTEEVLYRGYAVGIGQLLFGSLWVACAVSVVAFTLAHLKWGFAHLMPVFVSAVVFTLLFVFTRNLWLCILAHAIVDGAGFLAVPAAVRQRAQLGHNAG
ncbi:MAG: lysostaphin resistance A-like protein [Rhodanobacteraceae bacterium]